MARILDAVLAPLVWLLRPLTDRILLDATPRLIAQAAAEADRAARNVLAAVAAKEAAAVKRQILYGKDR